MPPSATRLFYCRSVGYELASTVFLPMGPLWIFEDSKNRTPSRGSNFGGKFLENFGLRAGFGVGTHCDEGTSMTQSTTRNGRWESVAIGLFVVLSFAALALACYLIWVKCAGSSHTIFGIFSNSHHEVQGVGTARPYTKWSTTLFAQPRGRAVPHVADRRSRGRAVPAPGGPIIRAIPGTSRPRPLPQNESC